MSIEIDLPGNIIKCDNPKCLLMFSVIGYAFKDKECTIISNAKLAYLTTRAPFYCPCCGKNLGRKESRNINKQEVSIDK